MKVVGFNFNKLSVEKTSSNFDKLNINTNIDLTDVKTIKSEVIQTKEELIQVSFSYSINYSPDIAKINLSGVLLIMVDSKTSKEFLDQWKDNKFPEEHRLFLFNVILRKSNLKALQLEDEMDLPLHIPLPSVKGFEQKE